MDEEDKLITEHDLYLERGKDREKLCDHYQNIFDELELNPEQDENNQGNINWLEKCRLLSRCYPIRCEPSSPLPALTKAILLRTLFKMN